jgi:hypothetical protein
VTPDPDHPSAPGGSEPILDRATITEALRRLTRRRSPVRSAGSREAGAFAGAPPVASVAVFGALRSSAQDSRWCASGRWTSQQVTEQNASAVRVRLQVETLQIQ